MITEKEKEKEKEQEKLKELERLKELEKTKELERLKELEAKVKALQDQLDVQERKIDDQQIEVT